MVETLKVPFDTFIMYIVVGLFFVNVVDTQLGRKFSKCTGMDCYFSYSKNGRVFVCGIVCPLDWGSRRTDGLKELAKQKDMYAYVFSGRRYDVGDKQGVLEATVEYALRNEELRDGFKRYLKELTYKETLQEVAVGEEKM